MLINCDPNVICEIFETLVGAVCYEWRSVLTEVSYQTPWWFGGETETSVFILRRGGDISKDANRPRSVSIHAHGSFRNVVSALPYSALTSSKRAISDV